MSQLYHLKKPYHHHHSLLQLFYYKGFGEMMGVNKIISRDRKPY